MGPEVALALTAVSTVAGVAGSIQQGQAASAAAHYQAQVARNNAQIAQQNAEYAQQAGETQAQATDFKSRAQLGAIDAAQSASGLGFDSPSLVDVREGAGQVLRMDTQNIYQNAALRSRAATVQAGDYEADAGLSERKASDASTAGTIGAVGSLLSGASGFADKWTRFYPASASKLGA